MIGMDPMTGTVRLTFGQDQLMDGLDFVMIAMGLFGLSEILSGLENQEKAQKIPKVKGVLPKREEWKPSLKSIGRGSLLGFLMGLIPGTNSVIPAICLTRSRKNWPKTLPDSEKGAIEGVAGPETANNSYCGGALIPLFTLGLPSSPTIAVLLGAFIMHGLTPGPTLFVKKPGYCMGDYRQHVYR